MTMTRIYIPLNAAGLRSLDDDRAVGGAPLLTYAVTDAVRASAPNAGQDDWEYTALNDAARSSTSRLTSGESRCIVAAADVSPDQVSPASPPDAVVESAVSISVPVALKRIASFHVGDNTSRDDSLLWYDVTELPVVLDLL